MTEFNPDCDNWTDYIMNREKITFYNDNLVFKNSGEVFTLKGDVLKLITIYKLNTADSRDAELNIDFLDEISFDSRTPGKSVRDRNLLKNF